MPDTDSRSSSALAAPSADAAAGEGLFERLKAFVRPKQTSSIRSDLEEVLEEGEPRDSGFTPLERAMLRNILDLRARRVGDVMVPRADIVAVQKDIPLGELLRVFANAGHSRLVVHGETLDDPVGMVHIRDLVAYLTTRAALPPEDQARRKRRAGGYDLSALDLGQPLSVTGIIRHILFVPPSMPAMDLLVKMQTSRVHLALVIDEYGGTDGLASIEDVVEQVVGEIEDEHDEDAGPAIVPQADGSYLADARVALEDVRAAIDDAFTTSEAAEGVDTLAGLIVTLAGRVPVRGEILPGPGGYEIEVLDADPRRVKQVRIAPVRESRPVKAPAEAAPAVRDARARFSPPPDRPGEMT